MRKDAIPEAGAQAHPTPEPDPPTGPTTGPARRPFGRLFAVRPIAGVALLGLIAWYLFLFETRADNDVVGGLEVLGRGLVDLPGIVFDPSAYRAWWTYVADQEGLDNVASRTLEHVQLVGLSMAIATCVSVAAGIAIHRVRALRGPVLGGASVLLTIPSLALFAFFISVPGIGVGDRGPIIALSLYSVLPILRNTVVGLEAVDRSIVEAAKGMGLGSWVRLRRIELPLAWPVVLTGIRVATLLNIGIAAIAPLVGGSGLGGYVRDGLQRFPEFTAVERMWTGVVFTVAVALLADLAFAVVRRLTTSKGLQP